jgi:plastocyanin domain-containing protein
LWIILLEMGLALALVAFLVWWTLPRKPKSKDRGRKQF